jgi:hypothetical protein
LNFSQVLTWPEISIQSSAFTDFHFLFHLFEIPFLLLPFSEMVNIKIFELSCLSFTVWQLQKYIESINPKIDYIFLTLFFVLGSPLFTGRMLFGRGIILFLGFYFLYLRYVEEGKLKQIFLVAASSVWCYAGFPLLLISSALLTFYDFSKSKILNLRLLIITLLGVLFGFIIHPSFPNQFYGYYIELFLQSMEHSSIEPIAEWMPPNRELIYGGVWFILPWIIYKLLINQEWKKQHFVFLSIAIVYLIFSTASLRLFEMFWIFAFLFIFTTSEESRIAKYISILLLVFLLFPNIYSKMRAQYKYSDPISAFDTANWLNQNTDKNERIFLAWGDYPYFVYNSPDKKYLFGLNPLYAWVFDSKKYELQRSFFEGSVPNFQYIPELMGYKYVIINKNFNQPVFDFLLSFKEMTKVYENRNYRVFFVKASNK